MCRRPAYRADATATRRKCQLWTGIDYNSQSPQLPEPMSKWFQPLPDDLSDLVGASKFQHETMARLIRFYKGKCSGQKELIERLRREVDTLKVS
jgi:hypothetical protein